MKKLFLILFCWFFIVQIAYSKKTKCRINIDTNFDGSQVYLKFKFEEKSVEWGLNEKGETLFVEFNVKNKILNERYHALFDKKGIYFLQVEFGNKKYYKVRNHKRGELGIKIMFDAILKNMEYIENKCEIKDLSIKACNVKHKKYLNQKERDKSMREKFLKHVPSEVEGST